MTGAIHQLCAIDALASLHSGPDGLDDAEAARRLGEFGPNRIERILAALLELLPRRVEVLRNGSACHRPIDEVVPLAQGDVVPADCRLVEAFHVRVNTATLTGESVPKARTGDIHRAGVCEQRQPRVRRNLARLRHRESARVRHRHAHGLCRTNADGRSVPGSLWTSIAAWAAVPDGPCS